MLDLRALALSAFIACGLLPQAWAADDIEIATRAVPLDSSDPARRRLGALVYMGGIEITSSSGKFGGLSGLAVSPDGRELLAVTDSGYWFAADLEEREDGWLEGLSRPVLSDLLRADGGPTAGAAASDAEALAVDWQARVAYVAFEGRHRVWRYTLPKEGGLRAVIEVPAEDFDTRGALLAQPLNRGTEALAWLPGRGLFAMSEGASAGGGTRLGWHLSADPPFAFRFAPPAKYDPTDAAPLRGDAALVLSRRAGWLSGLSAVLGVARLGTAEPGRLVEYHVLAHFRSPVTVDNFEGLALRRDGSGRPFVYLLSDDNFSPLQRTLLLKFALDEAAVEGVGAPEADRSTEDPE